MVTSGNTLAIKNMFKNDKKDNRATSVNVIRMFLFCGSAAQNIKMGDSVKRMMVIHVTNSGIL